MSIQSLADHELRSLVRYGSPKFAALASAELERRAKAKQEDSRALTSAATTPRGRWDS